MEVFLMRFSRNVVRSLLLSSLLTLAGCPMMDDEAEPGPTDLPSPPIEPDGAAPPIDSGPDAAAPPTHAGLVSIQDITIANLPAAGHGLTVTAILTKYVAPDFEDAPGSLEGCRAWTYDVATHPAPAEEDHGTLAIEGVTHGPLSCRFVAGRGYACPTATGTANITIAAASPTATVTVEGGSFAAADVGRYLLLTGGAANNSAASAIVAVLSAAQAVVANPVASAQTFSGSFTVLAGAGPTPNDLYEPFAPGTPVATSIAPAPTGAFEFARTELAPAGSFALDVASQTLIQAIPVTGEAVTLGCGDACGAADGTIVRITATDADVTGLSPVAMPPPKKKSVEIQCLRRGAGSESMTVPAAAMALLRTAHESSPLTRIRTAFMRDALAIVPNPPSRAPNVTYFAAGHGVLGFTQPAASP